MRKALLNSPLHRKLLIYIIFQLNHLEKVKIALFVRIKAMGPILEPKPAEPVLLSFEEQSSLGRNIIVNRLITVL